MGFVEKHWANRNCKKCTGGVFCAQTGVCAYSNSDTLDVDFIHLDSNTALAIGVYPDNNTVIHGTTNTTAVRFHGPRLNGTGKK